MSRSTKIVQFTFWMNVFSLVMIAALLIIKLLIQNTFILWTGVMITLIGATLFLVILKKKFSIKNFTGFYWIDDERDKEITLKVHSEIMQSMISFMYFILIIIPILLSILNATYLGLTIFSITWLTAFLTNIQYYHLWVKYTNRLS